MAIFLDIGQVSKLLHSGLLFHLYLSPLTLLSLILRNYKLLSQAVVSLWFITWSKSF